MSVNDNDTAGLVITTDDKAKISEGQAVTYNVRLKSNPILPSGTVTVTVVSDSSAVRLSSSAPLPLTFATGDDCDPGDSGDDGEWCRTKPVTVTAENDQAVLGNRPVTITFTPDGGDYGNVRPEYKKITVTDSDSAELEVPATLSLFEGAESEYQISLAHQPTGTVTVTVVSSDPSVATIDTDEDAHWQSEYADVHSRGQYSRGQ